MIPIWYKNKHGKYFTLTHYEDGKIGIPAVDFETRLVFTTDQLDAESWYYDVKGDRYLLGEEKS